VILGSSRLLYGPKVQAAARVPLSPVLVAQLRAADSEYIPTAQGTHGTSSGLSHHALQQEDPCAPCAAFLAELVRTGLARTVVTP
jgi:hypothetical protein